MTETFNAKRRIVLVTGPAGAGRSSALKVLEDAGFESVDNLPLRFLPSLLNEAQQKRPLALGIDPRNRDFSIDRVSEILGQLHGTDDLAPELLYLDCSTEVLLRRYSETRRRHPLALDDQPLAGIERELQMLEPLRKQADVLINTTDLNIHELRAEVEKWFAPDGRRALTVSVQSFSYKRGLPRSVDMVFDCRFLRNPFWESDLRALNGTDAEVEAYVRKDARFNSFTDRVAELSLLLLPAYREEGKSYFSIAFGCTGGQHRSVVVAQSHALRLAEQGWQVSIRHRELETQKTMRLDR